LWIIFPKIDISIFDVAEEKILANQRKKFDVFLCHKSEDKMAVKAIAEKLKKHGLTPWLREWELRPGIPWTVFLEEQIGDIKSAAVFVGESGLGPWQEREIRGC
jgi:hypothetical protein